MVSSTTLPVHVTEIIDQIAGQFRPERIILFGSHATGLADEGSDVDLLVVMSTMLSPVRQAVAIYRSLDHEIPADIVVRTPEQLDARNPRDIILRTALNEGITVHEASN